MFRSIIIGPDQELCTELQKAVGEVGTSNVVRQLNRYPAQIELARILRAHAPQLVFIGIDSIELCAATAAAVEQIMPGCQVVAVGRSCEADVLMTVMRAGIHEFLAYPFERRMVWESIERASQALRNRPMALQSTEFVYSFLPSKPGVGTTTIALNSALAIKEPGTLLTDFDLNCGMIRFELKIDSAHSIIDALEHAATMDEQLWPQLVVKHENLDLLHAGRSRPDIRIDTLQVQHLFDFARRNYKLVLADLSGNMERYSLEVMHESKHIFLVCTAEDASLHLAREKMQHLASLDLAERVRVLLNRHTKRSEVQPEHVEEIVGAPVLMTFANDYSRIATAIREGRGVDPKCDFGRQCGALAEHMLSKKAAPVEKRRKFVEYFTLTPAKFSFEGKRR